MSTKIFFFCFLASSTAPLIVASDIITVLGATDDATIKGAVEEAKKQKKKILVDMINVKDIES